MRLKFAASLIAACLFAVAAAAQTPEVRSADPAASQAPAAQAAPTTKPATTPAPEPAGEAPAGAPAKNDVTISDAGDSAGARAAAVDILPHDLSPVGMFLAADRLVKAVMLGLAFASVATWTLWLAKSIELALARRRLRRALGSLDEAVSLDEAAGRIGRQAGPASAFVAAAERELRRSAPALEEGEGGKAGVLSRIASELVRIEAEAGRRIAIGAGLLATIGATAPFVGLFGTVWGIMNSFIGISRAQTTNLAVVAPGIAEALLATALGLAAAIPAVIVYNVFARSITAYKQLLTDAATGVERLVSRDLDLARARARSGE